MKINRQKNCGRLRFIRMLHGWGPRGQAWISMNKFIVELHDELEERKVMTDG